MGVIPRSSAISAQIPPQKKEKKKAFEYSHAPFSVLLHNVTALLHPVHGHRIGSVRAVQWWLAVCVCLRCVPKTRAQCVCIVWHVDTIVNIYHV